MSKVSELRSYDLSNSASKVKLVNKLYQRVIKGNTIIKRIMLKFEPKKSR